MMGPKTLLQLLRQIKAPILSRQGAEVGHLSCSAAYPGRWQAAPQKTQAAPGTQRLQYPLMKEYTVITVIYLKSYQGCYYSLMHIPELRNTGVSR